MLGDVTTDLSQATFVTCTLDEKAKNSSDGAPCLRSQWWSMAKKGVVNSGWNLILSFPPMGHGVCHTPSCPGVSGEGPCQVPALRVCCHGNHWDQAREKRAPTVNRMRKGRWAKRICEVGVWMPEDQGTWLSGAHFCFMGCQMLVGGA